MKKGSYFEEDQDIFTAFFSSTLDRCSTAFVVLTYNGTLLFHRAYGDLNGAFIGKCYAIVSNVWRIFSAPVTLLHWKFNFYPQAYFSCSP